jgi:predicted Zn-dependent protease
VLGAVGAAYFGVDPGMVDYAARGAAQLISLKFSREDEREGDLIGLDLAARAGFDPRAGITLWRKMEAYKQRAGSGEPIAFLSTHPGGSERIDIMQRHLSVLMPVYQRAAAAQR